MSERSAQPERPDDWTFALTRSPVFGALSLDGRTRLAARGSVVALASGARLCSADDPADAAYLIITGELEIALSRPDGGEVWLARAAAGSVVGDMALLDGGVRSADMTATRNCRLLRLGRQALLDALEAEPAAALTLLADLARRLRAANGRLEDTTALDLGARLARLLLESRSGLVSRSQSEIARLVGAARETVNRKLSEWRKSGLIEIGRSGIRVLSPERLRAEASTGS